MTTLIQPPPPGYRKWWWVPVALVVLIVVVGAVVWLPGVFRTDNSCADGIVRNENGECVGITDGSFEFAEELGDITRRIREQNRKVDESGEKSVSIVLLTPMTSGRTSEGDVPVQGIQHRLAGAHLAQLTANETRAWAGRPKIKLLLANPGSDFSAWEYVVGEIEARRTDEKIVAVTGISFSFKSALAAVDRLTSLPEPVPVIASTLTVDDLAPERGFLKVSPSASEHARAAAEYLADSEGKVLIVRDDNPEDQYGRTLADAFAAQFADQSHRIAGRAQPYDGGADHVSTAFRFMMPNICQAQPSTVYFAGRGADAVEFLTALTERGCRDTPIQVITADDMPYYELADSLAGKALEANVTVRYTGLVHRDAWKAHRDQYNTFAIDLFSPECEGPYCYVRYSDGGLDDFAAVMEHDAVMTAVQAIRYAAGEENRDVDSDAVLQMMKQLHTAWAFRGASGNLDFGADGLPMNKPILILEARNGAPPLYLGSR